MKAPKPAAFETKAAETKVAGMFLAATALLAAAAGARIPEPDHIFYGIPTDNGVEVESGTVTVFLDGGTEALASYEIGSEPEIGQRYVVRIPMDSVDPQLPGTARDGDEVNFFLDGVPAGSGVINGRGTVQVLNIDPVLGGLPSLSISDVEAYEGDAGTQTYSFTVSLSEPTGDGTDVTFDYTTLDNTAEGTDGDYVEIGLTEGTIAGGDTELTIEVTVNGDIFDETDESFFVEISNLSSNAVALDLQGEGTILDDDTLPVISIADTSLIEGESGSSDMIFTLTLSRALPDDLPVTVDYATTPDTADEGTDYAAAAGTAVFNAETTTVSVEIFGDVDDEDDETFTVTLSNPSANATLDAEASTATGIILDDDGFLTFIEAEDLSDIEILFGAFAVAVTADGDHVYATGRQDDALVVMSRDSTLGAVDRLEVIRDDEGGVDGLDGAESLALSSDGAHVYVTAANDNSVAVFSRNMNSGNSVYGTLAFVEIHEDGIDGVDGLLAASGAALSPNGAHLYVAGSDDNKVAVFSRDSSAASADYGKLTYLEVHEDGVDGVDGLGGAEGVAVSPGDGNHVYVTGFIDNTVAVFSRDLATGLLTFVEEVRHGVDGVTGLEGATSVALSDDGAYLYVAGKTQGSLAVFSRDEITGELTFIEVHFDGAAGVDGLAGASDLEVSSDLNFVFATGTTDNALVVFDRNPITGRLTFRELQRDDFGAVTGLAGATGVAISPDDQHIYAAGFQDDSVVVFMRDALPPSDPLSIFSTSHTPSVFNNDPTIDIEWSGAMDNAGGSGLAGYSFVFDEESLTVPDTVVDLPHGSDPHTTTSVALADGISNYFHLRTCDVIGNCTVTSIAHLGPFYIDTTAPTDPPAINSSHPVGVPTADDTIDMSWSPGADNLSGVDGYAVEFNQSATSVCDQQKDLEENELAITSAALADGSWYFHLCTVDNAGNWTSTVTSGPHIVENGPPTVVVVGSLADTGDGVLAEGEAAGPSVSQLLVGFSEPVDAAAAGSAASYSLVDAGDDGVLSTTACGVPVGDDATVAIDGVAYDSVSQIATLSVGGGFTLPEQSYRLLVCSTIADLFANPLDGNADGTGGDDFGRTFRILATNLLWNPNFDTGVFNLTPPPDWDPLPTSPVAVSFSGEDADIAASSGSALLELASGTSFTSISQCVEIEELLSYNFGGRVRTDSGDPAVPDVFAMAQFHSSTNCTTGALGSEVMSAPVEGDTAGVWATFEATDVPAPATARSVYVTFLVDAGTSPAFEVYFDHLYVHEPVTLDGTIFSDGFESGDTTLWSNSVP